MMVWIIPFFLLAFCLSSCWIWIPIVIKSFCFMYFTIQHKKQKHYILKLTKLKAAVREEVYIMEKAVTSNDVKVNLEDYNVESSTAMQEMESSAVASLVIIRK